MYDYLKRHEKFIRDALDSGKDEYDWDYMADFHKTQIEYMQHERIIHLLVTLAFGVFLLISMAITVMNPGLVFGIFDLLIIILLVPYIAHYFKLENGVQRWYYMANEIEARRGSLDVSYGNTRIKKSK